MSYTYLQEQGEESSAASFADIPAYVLLRLNLTHERSYCNASATESCRTFQSGTTFEHSTGSRGEERSMLSAEDSHVRTLAQPEKGQESAANALDYGPRWQGSLARFNRNSSLWKTRQCLLVGGLESFSETWPAWGMMHDGECWEANTLEPATVESECGYLPTPCATDWKGGRSQLTRKDGTSTQSEFRHVMRVRFGLTYPIPMHSEAMMGWPTGWTELKPSETDRFQQWLASHGKFYHEMNNEMNDEDEEEKTPPEGRWDYDHGPDHMREILEG